MSPEELILKSTGPASNPEVQKHKAVTNWHHSLLCSADRHNPEFIVAAEREIFRWPSREYLRER